jgi:hypothetical protein
MHVFVVNASDFNQLATNVDWLAVMLAIVGFVALFRFNVSIIKLILIFAALGFLAEMLR